MIAVGFAVALHAAALAQPAPEAAMAAPAAEAAPLVEAPQQAGAPVDADTEALRQRVAELEDRVAQLETAAAVVPAPPSRPLRVGGDTSSSPRIEAGETVDDAVFLEGPVEVAGTVKGDAVCIGCDILVEAGGRIVGDAVSIGGEVIVHPDGEVEGDRVALRSGGLVPGVEDASGDARGLVARAARRLASLLSLAAAGVLVLAFWPRHIARIAETARARPIWHGLAGVILVGALGVGAGLLTLTILGIPIAAGLMLLLGAAWLLGFVAVCLAIGQRLPGGAEGRPPWVTFLAGAALVGLVSLVPVVGPVFLGLVGFEAVGSALVSRLGNRGDPDAW